MLPGGCGRWSSAASIPMNTSTRRSFPTAVIPKNFLRRSRVHPPKHSAEVLAEIMGGKAVPFPPNPGSFFALQLDDHGPGVEVYPAGSELQPAGEEGGSFVRKPREGRGFGATHFALSVAADAGKVKQIAERAGWHCVTCNRGPFHVIEVWVENDTMVEVLPPDFAAEYLAWARPGTVATRMTSAPTSGARHIRARSA
jgi:hypothetical protein